jgi:putative ABC transport system substrate-binding protein
LAAKRIELVKEMLPGISRVGLLANMSNPGTQTTWKETKRVEAALGFTPRSLDIRNITDMSPDSWARSSRETIPSR